MPFHLRIWNKGNVQTVWTKTPALILSPQEIQSPREDPLWLSPEKVSEWQLKPSTPTKLEVHIGMTLLFQCPHQHNFIPRNNGREILKTASNFIVHSGNLLKNPSSFNKKHHVMVYTPRLFESLLQNLYLAVPTDPISWSLHKPTHAPALKDLL